MQPTVKPVFWLAFVSVPVETFKVVHIKRLCGNWLHVNLFSERNGFALLELNRPSRHMTSVRISYDIIYIRQICFRELFFFIIIIWLLLLLLLFLYKMQIILVKANSAIRGKKSPGKYNCCQNHRKNMLQHFNYKYVKWSYRHDLSFYCGRKAPDHNTGVCTLYCAPLDSCVADLFAGLMS